MLLMFGKDREEKTASGIDLVGVESLVMMSKHMVERNDLVLSGDTQFPIPLISDLTPFLPYIPPHCRLPS